MKKNLFNFNLDNFSETNGSYSGQEACEPCSSECKKIKRKINNRKLSDLKNEDVLNILTPFKY